MLYNDYCMFYNSNIFLDTFDYSFSFFLYFDQSCGILIYMHLVCLSIAYIIAHIPRNWLCFSKNFFTLLTSFLGCFFIGSIKDFYNSICFKEFHPLLKSAFRAYIQTFKMSCSNVWRAILFILRFSCAHTAVSAMS